MSTNFLFINCNKLLIIQWSQLYYTIRLTGKECKAIVCGYFALYYTPTRPFRDVSKDSTPMGSSSSTVACWYFTSSPWKVYVVYSMGTSTDPFWIASFWMQFHTRRIEQIRRKNTVSWWFCYPQWRFLFDSQFSCNVPPLAVIDFNVDFFYWKNGCRKSLGNAWRIFTFPIYHQ